jgi:hypothetical protein
MVSRIGIAYGISRKREQRRVRTRRCFGWWSRVLRHPGDLPISPGRPSLDNESHTLGPRIHATAR